jgi:hypothetical protein
MNILFWLGPACERDTGLLLEAKSQAEFRRLAAAGGLYKQGESAVLAAVCMALCKVDTPSMPPLGNEIKAAAKHDSGD